MNDMSNAGRIKVITDHFTRYAPAFPTRDQKVTTMVKVLWDNSFKHHGFSALIHYEQGRDIESALMREVLAVAGIEK